MYDIALYGVALRVFMVARITVLKENGAVREAFSIRHSTSVIHVVETNWMRGDLVALPDLKCNILQRLNVLASMGT